MPKYACLPAGAGRAAALTVTAAALAAGLPAGAHACPNTSFAPGAVEDDALRRATRCLINAERERHGLRRLRRNAALGTAARRHAADMVARGYFAHERPGWTLAGRLRAAGWEGSAAAEAIAWGCGRLGVPSAIVDAWLASPKHRTIVLGRYTLAGIGVAAGAPYDTDCPGAGMYVLDAGR